MRLPNEFQWETESKNEQIHWPKCAFDRNHSVEYFLSSINADDDSHWFIFRHLFVGMGSLVYATHTCLESVRFSCSRALNESTHLMCLERCYLFCILLSVNQSLPRSPTIYCFISCNRPKCQWTLVYIYHLSVITLGFILIALSPINHWKHDKFLTVNKLWDRLWRRHHLLFVVRITDWPIRGTLLLAWQQLKLKNHRSQLSLAHDVNQWKSEVVCRRNGR